MQILILGKICDGGIEKHCPDNADLRPCVTKNVDAGVASLERIWSLAERSIPTYVTASKGPKAPKDAKQSKIFATIASVTCQKAFTKCK